MKRIRITYKEIAPGDFIVPPHDETSISYLTGLVISVMTVYVGGPIEVAVLDWKRGVKIFTAYLDAHVDVLR